MILRMETLIKMMLNNMVGSLTHIKKNLQSQKIKKRKIKRTKRRKRKKKRRKTKKKTGKTLKVNRKKLNIMKTMKILNTKPNRNYLKK